MVISVREIFSRGGLFDFFALIQNKENAKLYSP